jgi:AraC-like DNA-binding protein
VNHLTRVLQTPAVALETFEHPPHTEHCDPAYEVASGFCVSFVEGGSFRVRAETDTEVHSAAWHVTPETLFITTPGLVFSCRHDQTHPTDRCVSVAYAEAAIDHLLTAGAGAGAARSGGGTRAGLHGGRPASAQAGVQPGVRRLTNHQLYLRQRLGGCARGDEARLEALAGDLFFALTGSSSRQPLFRPELLSWYSARVERARTLMDTYYQEPLSLTRLSREVGMSPFHFARVFRELAGLPPHRYLTAVRLAHAARRLHAGASVTDTCLGVGFGSLSHFVTAFRRRYGVRPSTWGQTPRSDRAMRPRPPKSSPSMTSVLNSVVWRK